MSMAAKARSAPKPEPSASGAPTPVPTPFQQALASLSPAYFAMVMATGILSLACQLERMPGLPALLLALNLAGYLVLWGLTFLRMRRFPRQFLADFASHARGPGFFTTVAATCVLGTQMALQLHWTRLAGAMWWLAFALWLLLTYAVFTALTIRRDKPALEDGLNGGWLTVVVATQSLVILACTLLPDRQDSDAAAFGMCLLWLAGGMLYIWMISLIFYRYTFLRFDPQDLTPPYWINMGAMAISALAGSLLIGIADRSPLLSSLLPFLKGLTLLFWATASWWIPMLVILGVWRYVRRKVPLTYDPLYWGAVFPLAMYAVATHRLADAFGLPFLSLIPRLFVGLALTAWLLTFLGMILRIVVGWRRARRRAGAETARAPLAARTPT